MNRPVILISLAAAGVAEAVISHTSGLRAVGTATAVGGSLFAGISLSAVSLRAASERRGGQVEVRYP